MSRAALATGMEQTGDPQQGRVLARLDDVARAINNSPIARGRLLTEEPGEPEGTGLSFAVGVTRHIPHGLGRRATGFIEVQGADLASTRPSLSSVGHDVGISSKTHVSVSPAATGRCFLWVF